MSSDIDSSHKELVALTQARLPFDTASYKL